MALNRPWKGDSSGVGELIGAGRPWVCLASTGAVSTGQPSSCHSCMCTYDHKVLCKLLLGLQISFSRGTWKWRIYEQRGLIVCTNLYTRPYSKTSFTNCCFVLWATISNTISVIPGTPHIGHSLSDALQPFGPSSQLLFYYILTFSYAFMCGAVVVSFFSGTHGNHFFLNLFWRPPKWCSGDLGATFSDSVGQSFNAMV